MKCNQTKAKPKHSTLERDSANDSLSRFRFRFLVFVVRDSVASNSLALVSRDDGD